MKWSVVKTQQIISFVRAGLRIGTTEHLAIVEEVIVPGMWHRYAVKDMAPVRDSEPAPTAQQARNLPKRKIPKHVPKGVWLPSGPGIGSNH